ncbi:hypothetical protein HDV03_004655 [Kappamyces sp. JEL0829]|nr:hypothetical protein HDV03_004655 [Kappamyces sp. JEL0829]
MSYATQTDTIISCIANGLSLVASLATICYNLRSQDKSSCMLRLGIIQLGLLINSATQLGAIVALYLASSPDPARGWTGTNLMDFVGWFGNVNLFFIALVNLHVLNLFKILEPRATKNNIAMLRAILLGSFPILSVWHLSAQCLYVYNRTVLRWLSIAGLIGNVIWSIIVSTQDNVQTYILARAVWNLKSQRNLDKSIAKKFRHVIRILAVAVVIDWTCICVYVVNNLALGSDTVYYNGINMLVVSATGFHFCLTVWAFTFLRKFASHKAPSEGVIVTTSTAGNAI